VQGEKAKAVLASQHHRLETAAGVKLKYRGLLRTVYIIGAEEGVRSLYGGLTAALQRQLIFASIRLGYYDKVKHFYIDTIYGPHYICTASLQLPCPICAFLVEMLYAIAALDKKKLVCFETGQRRYSYLRTVIEECENEWRRV